jgi:hypothetical protein
MMADAEINKAESKINIRVKPAEYNKDLYEFIPKEILCILYRIHENQIIEIKERIGKMKFGKENR